MSGWLLKTAETAALRYLVRGWRKQAFPDQSVMELPPPPSSKSLFFQHANSGKWLGPGPHPGCRQGAFRPGHPKDAGTGQYPKRSPNAQKIFQVFSVAFARQTGHAYYEQGKGRQCAPMRPQENRLGQDLRPAVNIPGFRKEIWQGKTAKSRSTARPSIRLRQRADWRKSPTAAQGRTTRLRTGSHKAGIDWKPKPGHAKIFQRQWQKAQAG